MKTVFDNQMVAHVWAQQTQSGGRSSNHNFYFRDTTIYSYGSHFPIARFVFAVDGEGTQQTQRRAVLMTTRRRSISTTRHCSWVRRAIPSNFPIFFVKEPDAPPADALQDAMVEYARLMGEAPHKRMAKSRAALISQAAQVAASATSLAQFFGLPMPEWQGVPEKLRKENEERQAELRRRQEEENARQASEQSEVIKWWSDKGRGVWLSGGCPNSAAKADSIWHLYSRWARAVLPIALRLKNSDTVETTRGAEFPLSHGLKALPLIRRIKASGAAWHRNGSTIHLGHFQIDEVTAEGHVRAGCHFVPFEEVEALARIVEVSLSKALS